MSVAARPPTCRWVKYSVAATCTYTRPPHARPGVSSTCRTPACCSSSRTRSMNGPNRAAAWPRTPATNPTEQPTPSRSQSSPAARPTGTWLATVRLAAWANTPGPYWTRPPTPAGACPTVVAPQTGQTRAWTRKAVTTGRGGGGGASNTCRVCSATTGTPARPQPHPAQATGAHTTVWSGAATCARVTPGAPGCLPGLRPTGPAATGRLARRLGVGAVRAGRLAGVGGVAARLSLQLRHPLAKDHHLRPQLHDLRVGCRHPRPQLSELRIPCRQLGLVQLGLGGEHRPQLGVDRTLPPHRTQLLDRQAGQFTRRRLGHGRHDRHADRQRSTRSAHTTKTAFTLAE